VSSDQSSSHLSDSGGDAGGKKKKAVSFELVEHEEKEQISREELGDGELDT